MPDSRDQNFKVLTLDDPRQALELFAPDEVHLLDDALVSAPRGAGRLCRWRRLDGALGVVAAGVL